MENFIQIVTPSQKHTVLMPLTTVEGKLPTQFFRIHRSYIVNSDNIQSIERDIVNLGGDNSAPMSELYKDALIGQIVEGKVLKK
ncbi:MAG: LytTR family transcriptional regulator [Saprospiraceae bacterium]|nr:LytTR family transcriptional regulator [Saprospiraceae bacterium]